MKHRFASFLVDKSRIILIVFIAMAIAFACLIPFVNINYDMSEYLPDDSDMKRGMDLMEAEFGEETSSELSVMFGDLQGEEEKKTVKKDLEAIKYVDEVDYEPGDEDYNRGKYALFKISCDYDQYSDQAAYIFDTVKEEYTDSHEIYLGGSINSANVSGLPLWIAAVAVALVFIIILIMASSYIEPVAMLITIGIAVLINMGSYIFFPGISNTTFGIVAILQLVLSMDYSIMLMNRYRQERKKTEDKYHAMKDSLALSFGAITGSSLTTFAGLLALLFMSFKMGADIGLALAKGVVISLICIFTVLPALILKFDGLMTRTAKKTMKFNYPHLSRFQFRFRVPITLLFVVIFAVVLIARGNLDYTYAQNDESKIDDVFGCDNSIVMIYSTEDGTKAGALAEKLEDDSKVKSASCYEGTIGKERKAADMRSFIRDMAGSGYDMDIDTDMIRLIYYDYHAGDKEIKMTIPQFVDFLQRDVMGNDTFADSISDEVSDKINEMEKFTDIERLTTSMTAAGLADFFGMDSSQARQILLYYEIKKGHAKPGAMTLPEFVSFLIDDVSKDKTYGKMFDKATVRKLKSMQVYTDRKQMTTPVDYQTAAQYLGMEPEAMLPVYQYYFAESGEDPEKAMASVQDMVNFMITDENMRGALQKEQLQQLETLAGMINISVSGRKLSVSQMAKATGMNKSVIRSIYLLHDYKKGRTGKWKLSPQQFINFMVSHVLSDSSMEGKAGNSAEELKLAQKLINNSVNGTAFTSEELANLLGGYSEDMDAESIGIMYKYYGSKNRYDEEWTMNLQGMVHHLDDEIIGNPAYGSMIDGEQKEDINKMRRELDDGAELLEGEEYGRMIITTSLKEDGTATRNFMDKLTKATETFGSECYFIGNTPMAYEMSKTFKSELNRITIITALFIFMIVLLTYRNLATPIILVLIIQCAVYVTMGIMNLIDYDMNYLALLIVQSIMMGATIDYGIIYSTYYIENRQHLPPAEAIKGAFKGSMQTILTSSLILIVAVGILSFAFSEIATRQICRILSAGCLTATVLVIFVLPAILACFDRLVVRKKKAG